MTKKDKKFKIKDKSKSKISKSTHLIKATRTQNNSNLKFTEWNLI